MKVIIEAIEPTEVSPTEIAIVLRQSGYAVEEVSVRDPLNVEWSRWVDTGAAIWDLPPEAFHG